MVSTRFYTKTLGGLMFFIFVVAIIALTVGAVRFAEHKSPYAIYPIWVGIGIVLIGSLVGAVTTASHPSAPTEHSSATLVTVGTHGRYDTSGQVRLSSGEEVTIELPNNGTGTTVPVKKVDGKWVAEDASESSDSAVRFAVLLFVSAFGSILVFSLIALWEERKYRRALEKSHVYRISLFE